MFDETPEEFERGYGWRLVDARPFLKTSPYTFFVPSEAEKAAIEIGEPIKLEFESLDPDVSMTERMWVSLEGKEGKAWFGTLLNQPYEIEGLNCGDTIRFESFHILSVLECKLDSVDEDKYRMRCHVDARIVYHGAKVSRIERRKPKKSKWWNVFKRTYPDTGWYLFTDTGEKSSPNKMEYLGIGAVLNKDDSWLVHLDDPVGTTLVRNGDGYQSE